MPGSSDVIVYLSDTDSKEDVTENYRVTDIEFVMYLVKS